MFFDSFDKIAEMLLFISCVLILIGCVYITVKLRFVQFRFFPALFSLLKASFSKKEAQNKSNTILPHTALITAMSTTLGISTIVAPVIACNLGGPGALLGFLLTSFFGSAATYAEVNLCITHRKRHDSGAIMGGPMQYLKAIFSPFVARWYAVCCLALMLAWSAAQANQVAAILDSPLIEGFRVSTMLTGAVTAVFVLVMLMGGIKRVGWFSMIHVPLMFVIYVGSCLFIVLSNLDKMGGVLTEIFTSFLSPQPMASGILVGGAMSGLRWGIFKGIQCCETGIGTQTMPHSMAETKNPVAQGLLAMLSTYTAGVVAFLSGCVALLTKTWQDPSLPLGMSMVAASFEIYFSTYGIWIITVASLLFASGPILGNCYNGSQCFGYLTDNKRIKAYYIASACMVFVGAIADVKTLWSVMDIVLACTALPHIAALVVYAYKEAKAGSSLTEDMVVAQ
ncbi:MAG: alanine:cation symporter family protein [Chlamydiales bacterium]|nr:alanine:cation symporter family protein [Chlamydiales bacterium]